MAVFEVGRGALAAAKVDVVAVGATASPALEEAAKGKAPPRPALGAGAAELADATRIDLAAELEALRFDGSAGSIARIPTRGTIPAATIVVVGLGKPAEVDREPLRRAAAAVADACSRVRSLATTLPAAATGLPGADAAQAVVEGLALASYRFNRYRTKADEHELERVIVLPAAEQKSAELKRGVATGWAAAEAAMLARDLVNEPPASKRPPAFAERARELLRGTGVRVRVLDEAELEKGGYGGLLGVAAGSEVPPRLVELSYSPRGASRHVALIGKGITFDSGGLSLKTSDQMKTMKLDMAGAAAVLAAVKAAAVAKLKVRITGLLALAENMPSGSAIRPGDVLTIHGGKTVEVLNTDAEGRLVLADAIVHAARRKPDVLVDVATLTGGALIALGPRIGAVLSTDDDLAGELVAASQRTGELLWRLPLHDEYLEAMKSDVADIQNTGPREASTIRGALFLKEFVPQGVPWAHLDVAGLSWSDEQYGYVRKGGTGAPVRTLLSWLGGLG